VWKFGTITAETGHGRSIDARAPYAPVPTSSARVVGWSARAARSRRVISSACEGQIQKISLLLQEALFEIREPGLVLCVAELSKDRLLGKRLGVPAIVQSESHVERDEPMAWLKYEWKQLQQMVREESSTLVE